MDVMRSSLVTFLEYVATCFRHAPLRSRLKASAGEQAGRRDTGVQAGGKAGTSSCLASNSAATKCLVWEREAALHCRIADRLQTGSKACHVTVGTDMLLLESAMIQAPRSFVMVRLCQVVEHLTQPLM
jgi:hypothetical protein